MLHLIVLHRYCGFYKLMICVWQLCPEQVRWPRFPSSTFSLGVSVLHFGNSHNNLNFFIFLMLVKCESESCSVVSDSLQPYGLYSPWNFPGQNTAVGSLSLLQGIFPTQLLHWSLLHCRQIFFFSFFYQLSYQGSSL